MLEPHHDQIDIPNGGVFQDKVRSGTEIHKDPGFIEDSGICVTG